ELEHATLLKVEEQEPQIRLRLDVAEGVEHVVARIVRKGKGPWPHDADESGSAPAVRGVRPPFAVSARDEEALRPRDPLSLAGIEERRLSDRRATTAHRLHTPRLDVLLAVPV